jgi:hypothetical protein
MRGHDLTPDEEREWERFVHHMRRSSLEGITRSAVFLSLVPSTDEPDIQFACELGLAILMDKPVIALAMPGREVPPGLRRVAHAVIELRHDPDTPEGEAEMREAIEPLRELIDKGGR